MADLPDFPSWVAEAEKWEAAIRKDERAKAVAAVVGKMRTEVYQTDWNAAVSEAAKAIEGKANY